MQICYIYICIYIYSIYISPQQDQRNTCSLWYQTKKRLQPTGRPYTQSTDLWSLGTSVAIHGQNSTIPATNTDLAFNRRVGNDVFPNKGVIFRVYFGWDLKQVSRIYVFFFFHTAKVPTNQNLSELI